MKPLTAQQAAIRELADRGYPAPQIARHLGIAPSLVPDQVHAMRRKGYDVRLVSAREARRTVNMDEAKRISRSSE